MSALAKSNGLKYSKYVDDITFSDAVEEIKLNNNKKRFLPKCKKQKATGIVMNDNRLSVKPSYIRWMRQESHYIENYGLESHLERENI